MSLTENKTMPSKQPHRTAKAATASREHPHRLWAVLYLGGALLLFNAWLISQNLVGH
jgi:hypothetical protein